jgi:hypothetical protein
MTRNVSLSFLVRDLLSAVGLNTENLRDQSIGFGRVASGVRFESQINPRLRRLEFAVTGYGQIDSVGQQQLQKHSACLLYFRIR